MRARRDAHPARDRSSAFAGAGRTIVDEMIDDYVSWREACAAVAVSYDNWRCSDPSDQKLAFSVYVAALDREEQAAAAYRRAIAQVATALAGRHTSSLEESSTDGPHRSAEVTEVRLARNRRRAGDWFKPRARRP